MKKPKYFILENVKGLLSNDKGKTWKTIWEALNKLQGYAIDWKILNTKDYGIPQSRERLFIVGKRGGKYMWPMPSGLKEATALSEMVEKGLPSRVPPLYIKKVISANPGTRCIFFNPVFRKIWPSNEHACPCITAAGPRFWCVPESRDISSKEMMRLQGFPTDFIQVVSEKQMKKQLGNSMSVNVIEKIIKSLFY
jgi:DNA (cytosine-5)-methyltransferase 1